MEMHGERLGGPLSPRVLMTSVPRVLPTSSNSLPVRWASPEPHNPRASSPSVVRVGSILSAVPPAAGSPMCVAVGTDGQRFVGTKTAIYSSSPEGFMSLLAGSAHEGGFADGVGVHARFGSIFDMEVHKDGHVMVADGDNHCVRMILPDATVRTVAGCPKQKGFKDGAAATARFNLPCGIALDHTSNVVYIADRGNNRIRKINAGGVVCTVAGNGQAGLADGHGEVARFDGPKGIAVDAHGNVIIADVNNNCIRMVLQEGLHAEGVGLVSTIAGAVNGESGSENGEGVAARFKKPCDIVVDAANNFFVTDWGNNCIRKISSIKRNAWAGAPKLWHVSTLVGSGNGDAALMDGEGPAIFHTHTRTHTQSHARILAHTSSAKYILLDALESKL